MTKNDNILDEMFRSKLEDFEQTPPSYVWDQILEKQVSGKKKRMFLFFRIGGIAAAILIAFIMGWQLQNSQPDITGQQVVAGQEQDVEADEAAVELAEQKTAISETETESMTEDLQKSTSPKVAGEQLLADHQSVKVEHIEETAVIEESRESFSLLRLLGINFDEPGVSADQLANLDERRKNNSTLLNELDLALIEMNMQQLAMNSSEDSKDNWRIGAMVSPSYSVNQTSYDAAYASNMSNPGQKDDLQMGGGISVEYKTNKRWSVQSGVYYSQLGQSSANQRVSGNYDYAFAPGGADYNSFNTAVEVKSGEMLMNASAGVIEIENLPSNVRVSNSLESVAPSNEVLLTNADFEQNFEYIEIPLLLRYQLVDAVFDVQLLGGVNAGFLVGNNTYIQNEDGKSRIGKTKDMNSINYSTSFGVGFGYGIGKNLQLRFEPQLKYYLGSLNGNSSVSFKPYTIGVYTGLTYQF